MNKTTVDLCDEGLWEIGKGSFDGCTLLYGIAERIARIKEGRLKSRIELEEQTFFDNECAVCMVSKKTYDVFVRCGHLCVCEVCAGSIKNRDHKCPLCQMVSERIMKVYYYLIC